MKTVAAVVAMVLGVVMIGVVMMGGGLVSSSASESESSTGAVTVAAEPDVAGLAVVAVADLPAEAHQTLELIDRGGPFPYSKDGSTFFNREGLLPAHDRGYYREYTVPTPGEDDRGARRIVTGNDDREFFYTGDHYNSFAVIDR